MCSSRSGVSEEHTKGQKMAVCLSVAFATKNGTGSYSFEGQWERKSLFLRNNVGDG
jgi:hypothetical protein